mgnify:CR=1 FL=1
MGAGRKAQGVLGAVGGHSAGWSLWLDAQSRPVFTYRMFDVQTTPECHLQALL